MSSIKPRKQPPSQHAHNGFGTAQLVAEHPASSLFVLFAVGVGIGFALGHILSDSMMQAAERDQSWRRRMLRSWQGALPEALATYLKQA